MPKIEVVVYRDKEYPSAWISEEADFPERISSFLEEKGLSKLDAGELRDFMRKSIQEGTTHTKIISFSQDVVPDTVAEAPHPDTLLRGFPDPFLSPLHPFSLRPFTRRNLFS